jgi:hypothetical protein
MNLMDMYLNKIGQYLPRKSRADIEAEIRSTLEDMLEDRSRKAGHPADDEMIKDLLKAYGAPDKVAATYLPARYLIGPRLYPTFLLVLKIVLAVLVAVALLGFGLRLAANPITIQSFVETLAKSLGEFAGGGIAAFGNLVLIFALLQWALPPSEFGADEQAKVWDPASLLAEPDPDRVRGWEPIAAIVVNIVAILIFNFYPQIVGFYVFSEGQWTSIPVLSGAFFHALPWINSLCVLQIVLNVILLRQGRWQTATRWCSVAVDLFGIAVAAILLTGPSLVALGAEQLAFMHLEPTAAHTLASLFSQMPVLVLVVIVLAGSAGVVKTVYQLIAKPRPGRPAAAKS